MSWACTRISSISLESHKRSGVQPGGENTGKAECRVECSYPVILHLVKNRRISPRGESKNDRR
ncbi:hypothetical protein [Acetobacter sp.]